jgi:ATP-dependent helicase HrpA
MDNQGRSQVDKRAEQRAETRRALVPVITYPDLPVTAVRDDIRDAIAAHQVVVVAGETGSGKTTQLPKILLDMGRGVHGQIGHTQPRRIAARAVADRIAEELDLEVGGVVGYKVRFTDHSSDNTLVKVMTDGILLAEIQRDRLLRRYDTIIIDEAHERSLTIDFLLGYLKQLLPKRPDLKLIITSATIDTDRFSKHFDDAPVIEVSGRTYPVAVRYRPFGDDADEGGDDRDQNQAICDAIRELCAEGPGDILVFLSGEREIRDAADAVRGMKLPDTSVLPLYARLSAAEQHRVFESHSGRRVVLSTNVAETSLTVPGIRYVIDPGLARISRYSTRLKVQRLPIEKVSQASANQRSGRCGRVADGIAIRLYSDEDFLQRPEFTEPEILRTNLASVILSMTALGLGEVEGFPFVDPPDARQIRDGVELLRELGALKAGREVALTPVGYRLSRLPIDPRLGRMIIEAERNDVVADVLVIASALSIQDPRERPSEAQAQADQAHARFNDPTSDFFAYLGLWTHLKEQQRELSGNAFRRMCRSEYLHYLRIREWQDLHSQLRQACKELDISINPRSHDASAVTRSLIAGLLSHVGAYDQSRRDYLGARGARWSIHRSSNLAKKPPAFAVAAELVETARLFGRVVTRVDPLEVERVAGDLVTRTYSEPRWSRKRGSVVADERVTLYGVTLVSGRRVQYGRIDPVVSRDLFIRHALVDGEHTTPQAFLKINRALIDEISEVEDKVRRRDLAVDEERLFGFFDERIPATVFDVRTFDRWWKQTRRNAADLLTYPRDLLLPQDQDLEGSFPRVWSFGADAPALPLTYAFEPGLPTDGVTVDIPLSILPQLDGDEFLWQVPGRREEIVTALIRGLPKSLRTSFVPVPDTTRAVLDEIEPGNGGLLASLTAALRRRTGVVVPPDAWNPADLPEHLRMNFRVLDESEGLVASGRDLRQLQQQLKPEVQHVVSYANRGMERVGLTEFPTTPIPRRVEETIGEHVVPGWPALVDRGSKVDLRVFTTEAEQETEMRRGVLRLLLNDIDVPTRYVVGVLNNSQKLALAAAPHASVQDLILDAHRAVLDQAISDSGGVPWSAQEFAAVVTTARDRIGDRVLAVVRQIAVIIELSAQLRHGLDQITSMSLAGMRADMELQLSDLLPADFVTRAGLSRLDDLVRYLRAMLLRLEAAPRDTGRDAIRQQQVEQVLGEWHECRDRIPKEMRSSRAALEIEWMIQELRVNLFAQKMGAKYPISDKRIYKAMDAIVDG